MTIHVRWCPGTLYQCPHMSRTGGGGANMTHGYRRRSAGRSAGGVVICGSDFVHFPEESRCCRGSPSGLWGLSFSALLRRSSRGQRTGHRSSRQQQVPPRHPRRRQRVDPSLSSRSLLQRWSRQSPRHTPSWWPRLPSRARRPRTHRRPRTYRRPRRPRTHRRPRRRLQRPRLAVIRSPMAGTAMSPVSSVEVPITV